MSQPGGTVPGMTDTPAVSSPAEDVTMHRRGTGASASLCSYCVQPWPCPTVERHTYGAAHCSTCSCRTR